MKARVKATGEIVEVHTSDDADFVDRNGKYYWEHELFFGSLDVSSYDDPDYWTRLEHTYAGMDGFRRKEEAREAGEKKIKELEDKA